MQSTQNSDQEVFEGHDICDQLQCVNISENPVNHVPEKQKSMALSYISAVLYPLILCGLMIWLYSSGETTVLGMLFGIAFSVAMGVTIGMVGFYLIVIPLPYIFVYKGGCSKSNQSTKRKVILGLLTFVFFAMAFVSAFVLKSLR